MSAVYEFVCVECGLHVTRIDGVRPEPLLCGYCIHIPGWHEDPATVALLDPERNHQRTKR